MDFIFGNSSSQVPSLSIRKGRDVEVMKVIENVIKGGLTATRIRVFEELKHEIFHFWIVIDPIAIVVFNFLDPSRDYSLLDH